MEIKVIGENSSNRMKLLKNINKAVRAYDGKGEISILEGRKEIIKYGITNVPGLVINGKLVSQGKVLTEREITNYMKLLS